MNCFCHDCTKRQKLIENLLAWFIAILVLVSLFGIMAWSLKKSEQNECVKWARQAKEIPGFYYTGWQKSQCNIK